MPSKAKYPESGYSHHLDDAKSLVVSVVGESGESFGRFDFTDIKAPHQLMVELVRALQSATNSSGRWRTKSSVRVGVDSLRGFAKDITIDYPELQTMADFTAEMWWSWREKIKSRSRWPGRINLTRCLLYEVECHLPTTRTALGGREKKPKNRLYQAYSETEYRRIYASAWSVVRKAQRRIRPNVKALKQYQDGNEGIDAPTMNIQTEPWSRGRVLNHMLITGKAPQKSMQAKWNARHCQLFGVDSFTNYADPIFATTTEVFAGIVLLVCERGFNRSVLNEISAEPHISDIDRTVTVQTLDKPRRGPNARYFSSTFAGKTGKIWRAIAEITQPARDHLFHCGTPTDLLLVGRVPSGVAVDGLFKSDWTHCRYSAVAFQKMTGLTLDNGDPLKVDFRKIRLTEQIVNQRASQNTDTVSETIYRRPEKQTKDLAAEVILQGQADAIADAKAVIAIQVLSSDSVDEALTNPEALSEELGISVSRIRQLLSGKFDTAVSACTDIKNSPFSEAGSVCTASFLQCFSCRNAIATPKHLSRIVILYDAIAEVASVVDQSVWNIDYKAVYHQIDVLLQSSTTSAERENYRKNVSDKDRKMIRDLLSRRFDV